MSFFRHLSGVYESGSSPVRHWPIALAVEFLRDAVLCGADHILGGSRHAIGQTLGLELLLAREHARRLLYAPFDVLPRTLRLIFVHFHQCAHGGEIVNGLSYGTRLGSCNRQPRPRHEAVRSNRDLCEPGATRLLETVEGDVGEAVVLNHQIDGRTTACVERDDYPTPS